MATLKDWVIPINCFGILRRKNAEWIPRHGFIILSHGQAWCFSSLQDYKHVLIKLVFHRTYCHTTTLEFLLESVGGGTDVLLPLTASAPVFQVD